MRKYWFFALLLLIFSAAESFAACHAVGPAATGNGSGSSWSNMTNKLPSSLVRGDTYYLADGSYGSYGFSTANSGTTRITIKKAQSYDFGRTSDGCSNDISAGWNASTMGSSQAVFTDFGTSSTQGYVTWDGNGRATNPGCGTSPATKVSASDCGIKTSGQGTFSIGQNANGANRNAGWTIRYTEVSGPGDNQGSGEYDTIFCHGGCDQLLLEHNWWYNSSCVFLKIPWSNGFVAQFNYFKQNFSASQCHGQMWMSEVNVANADFHGNIFSDIQGTAVWTFNTGCQANNVNIYSNVVMYPQGSSRPGTSNGIFACINSGSKCNNIKFIGNTVVNGRSDYSGAFGIRDENGGGSYTWQNNLFYSTPSGGIGFGLGSGTTLTEDHNSWLNSGSPKSGTGDITVTSGAANPFVDWPNSDFRLTGQNANWGAGLTLPSPFNVDMAGNLRPGSDGVWDRGAFDAASQASAPPLNPPTGLTASVQ